MMAILVDSNVILDILSIDPVWFDWSRTTIEDLGDKYPLFINPIVYAEVSVRFDTLEALEGALPPNHFGRRPIPCRAAFLAGQCYRRYRLRGGTRRSPLPDFFIGAHAAVEGLTLLTRDASRYRTYFPKLQIIAPD